jgi:hypothetical protein
MAKIPGSNTEKIVEVLSRHGLDASVMPMDGWWQGGFYEFVLDSAGKRVMGEDGSPLRHFRDWPDDTVYEELCRAYWFG